MTTSSPLDAAWRDAAALRDAGDLGAARDLLERALAGARPAYGEDHPDVLATALALARLHRAAGDTPAARRLLEEALAAGERRHGDAHALMLAISYDLGDVAEELGNRHEARRNFSRVASFGPAVLGQDHWAVRAAVDYLGTSAAVADDATRPITSFTPAPGPVPRLAPDPARRPRSLADLLPARPDGPIPPADTATLAAPAIPWPPHGAGRPAAGAPTYPATPEATTARHDAAQPVARASTDPATTAATTARHDTAQPAAYPATPDPTAAGRHAAGTPTRIPPQRPANRTDPTALPAGSPTEVPAPPAPTWPDTPPPVITPTVQPDRGWQAATSWPPTPTPPPPATTSQATSAPPAYPRKGRTATVAAVVAAIAAVMAVVLVAVALLTRGDPPPNRAAPTPGPTITGEPPTDLRLRDDGDAVTLTWTDPTAGTVPFILAAGRTGEQLQLMATVNPGDTDFTANGLNARVDYCFTVLAVYGTDRYAPTNQICTTRTSPSPRNPQNARPRA